MTSAAQEMMVCLYRNQLLNVFVRVAMITIPINSCVRDTLPIGKQLLDFSLPVFIIYFLFLVIYLTIETVVCSTQYLMVYVQIFKQFSHSLLLQIRPLTFTVEQATSLDLHMIFNLVMLKMSLEKKEQIFMFLICIQKMFQRYSLEKNLFTSINQTLPYT